MNKEKSELTPRELMMLSAEDSEFYGRFWFPKTMRQTSPDFHGEMWAAMEDPDARYIAEMIFRGGAKTTLARVFTSKRIAFAMSRTILFVSETQDHAKRSTRWIKRQIMYNKPWAEFFQLRLGEKKTDEWLEIYHGIDEVPITLLALGITGQTRGVNIDDFRPDLIIVDDPCNEENTATAEARKKTSDLFFGSLQKSLAPPTEAQDAKMILLQTILNGQDLIATCHKDPQWRSLIFSCFNQHGESRWEARFPTKWLLEEKQAHVSRNQLSLWLREMECKVTSEATAAFKESWIRYYEPGLLPERMTTFYFIDPVPPPSDRQLSMGLKDKDWEVHAVVGLYRGKYYLCEYKLNRGHEPDWSVATFWEMIDKWKPRRARVETVNYQRTLKWLLEQSMKQRSRYVQLSDTEPDRRKKSYRIIDALSGPCSNGEFYVNKLEHSEFIEQFSSYPDVEHDDVIEAVAEALKMAVEDLAFIDGDFEELDDDDFGLPKLRGYAP
jgi:phage terminase large subunit-like protein